MVSAVGIVIPILIFLLSGFMVPEGKDECNYGWLDCFPTGKLALTPLVLWAAYGLYAFQIKETSRPLRKSAALGLFVGAIVSSVCFIAGLLSTDPGLRLWLIIPLYVAIWYGVAALCVTDYATLKAWDYVIALGTSIPFWIGSVLLSQHIYAGLPDRAPTCFVVTAASRGHRRIVGPFFATTRRGQMRFANQQLLTFWQFEFFWQSCSPRTHAAFRRVYNRIGPIVAGHIQSPWLADAVYVALKPIEILALLLNLAVIVRRGSVSRSSGKLNPLFSN
ncbi:MAG TPA: DUF6688 family protein [Candidatus Angelobacter sp.]|nr:DUF6688 family protein [Candidatus Angelobacter sp.]